MPHPTFVSAGRVFKANILEASEIHRLYLTLAYGRLVFDVDYKSIDVVMTSLYCLLPLQNPGGWILLKQPLSFSGMRLPSNGVDLMKLRGLSTICMIAAILHSLMIQSITNVGFIARGRFLLCVLLYRNSCI